MWLMSYITKNLRPAANAVKGSVSSVQSDGVSVLSAGEHKGIKVCLPYGVVSVPPTGEQAIVLPIEGGEVSIGVLQNDVALEDGEVMLFSKGGASIALKNDGKVYINGEVYS